MTAQRVLFVGDALHHEFREPTAWLREYCQLTLSEDIDAALVRLSDANDPPEIIVVAAATPGRFSQSDIESLLRQAPLARIVGLMGGWCEGELRTGQPWRGVTRVYWHQFVPRMAEELADRNVRQRSAMPRTFTEAEHSGISVLASADASRGLIVIRAATLECYEAIAEACRSIGHSTVWENPRQPAFSTGAVAAIWDAASSIERDEDELTLFARQMHPAPTLAIIGFVRNSDRQLALDYGASVVISKPYLLRELWAELTRMTDCEPTHREQVAAA